MQYVKSEVYYLHEMCQPAITHTTALYSKYARAHATSLITGFPSPALPAVGHHGIGVSMQNQFLENLKF